MANPGSDPKFIENQVDACTEKHLSVHCQTGAARYFVIRFYSIRKSISLMISIPSTEAVEFVFIARMTFL